MFDLLTLLQWLFILPILLFSLTIHEFSHGYIAWLCGDPTPKMAKRLTLNPLKHLDFFGTITLLLTKAIGWAKPVPVNPNYFHHPWRDLALVSLAGPLSNLLLAYLFALITYSHELFSLSKGPSPLSDFLKMAFYLGARINLALAIFNLLPIPPLDGSKIVVKYLPLKLRSDFLKLEMMGFLIILFLALTGLLGRFLHPILNLLTKGLFYLASLPLSIFK